MNRNSIRATFVLALAGLVFAEAQAQWHEKAGHSPRPMGSKSQVASLRGDALPVDSSNCKLVGNWPFGPSYAVALDSARNLAFCGSGGGVYVLDVSDSSNPVKLSEAIHTPGLVYSLCHQVNRLYIAAFPVGLEIWDVSVPESPALLGRLGTPGSASGVAVAFVADYDSGLRVIDVSNPQNPQEVGHCDTPGYASGVAVAGNYAYVADESSGLRVIDVSNPQNPQEVGHYDTPGSALGVALAGSYAYVADYDSGLRVIDVSDPQDPQEVGYYDTPGYAFDVAVAGSYAYVADYWSGLQMIRFYGAGLEETPNAEVRATNSLPTVIRGVLSLTRSLDPSIPSSLLDISGRKVLDLSPGANDVSRLAPGVYFVAEQSVVSSQHSGSPAAGGQRSAVSIRKVAVLR